MAKKALPLFTRDHRTGSMKEFTPSEPNGFALASDKAGPPYSRVLVADDDETDRLLTIWHLGKAWPVELPQSSTCRRTTADANDKLKPNRNRN
jgi:hypothetical protein